MTNGKTVLWTWNVRWRFPFKNVSYLLSVCREGYNIWCLIDLIKNCRALGSLMCLINLLAVNMQNVIVRQTCIFAQSERRIKIPLYGAVWVYGTRVNDPSVGSVMFLRIINSTSLLVIAIQCVWLECINFGLTMKSSGDSVPRHSPVSLEE